MLEALQNLPCSNKHVGTKQQEMFGYENTVGICTEYIYYTAAYRKCGKGGAENVARGQAESFLNESGRRCTQCINFTRV